jgi:signal transduction histidine kinase
MESSDKTRSDAERIEALLDCDGFASADSAAFDELTRHAAEVLNVPIALIMLIDDTRQWFKSYYGLEAAQLPRITMFCAHAVRGRELFTVADTLMDERFADHPMVVGAPNIRFCAAVPLVSPDGQCIGTLCVVDHEPRYMSEDERRALTTIAKQVLTRLELGKLSQQGTAVRLPGGVDPSQEVRDFVYLVSHDLRAPLSNVMAFAEELQRCSQEFQDWLNQYPGLPSGFIAESSHILAERFVPVLDFIHDSATRMNGQVSSLLALAHDDHVELHHETVDLGVLLRSVVDSHKIELKRSQGSVELGPLGTVRTDGTVMQHVFDNLIENAIEYRSEQRVLRIRVSMDRDPQGIVVHVQDNGRGIAVNELPMVFEIFRRAGPRNTLGEGVGLCLARALIRRLGGQIWCDSTLDEGTTFHVALPTRSQTSAGPSQDGDGDPGSMQSAKV